MRRAISHDLLDGVAQVGDIFIVGHCLRHQCDLPFTGRRREKLSVDRDQWKRSGCAGTSRVAKNWRSAG